MVEVDTASLLHGDSHTMLGALHRHSIIVLDEIQFPSQLLSLPASCEFVSTHGMFSSFLYKREYILLNVPLSMGLEDKIAEAFVEYPSVSDVVFGTNGNNHCLCKVITAEHCFHVNGERKQSFKKLNNLPMPSHRLSDKFDI